MLQDGSIFLGAAPTEDGALLPQYLGLKYANRHGLVTGATGTGKTVTLQILAEGFSAAGVPVFAADVKGDLSGIGAVGEPKDFLQKRAEAIGFAEEYKLAATPTLFLDLFGEQGHPVRTTISDMGPLILARLMGLNETQEGVLNIAFRIADDEGLPLLDLKDLQAMLMALAERAGEVTTKYGNVTKPTIGAIQRQLLVLEEQGGNSFFGEPALRIADLMRTDPSGRGYVSVLAADKLMQSPRLYATFLLWLLSELFEELPEVGDVDKPRLVFFFDEAHLLFDDAPKALVDKVEQVVKLIRSKGIGVFFVTQNPLDIPESVLAQLGNRIQHALRAYTPREKKAVDTAAETFRPNPAFDAATVITELGVGEALVSTLGKAGVPSMVERTLIRPPSALLGPIDAADRTTLIRGSPIFGQYDKTLDSESAYEILAKRTAAREAAQREAEEAADDREVADEPGSRGRPRSRSGFQLPDFGGSERTTRAPRRSYQRQTVAEAAIKSVIRSVGSSVGRALVRGILGSLKR